MVIRAAVERQYEIIGEALRRAIDIKPGLVEQITDARKIIAFRNQVIHGYDVIDHTIVWGVVERYLLTLLAEARALLQAENR